MTLLHDSQHKHLVFKLLIHGLCRKWCRKVQITTASQPKSKIQWAYIGLVLDRYRQLFLVAIQDGPSQAQVKQKLYYQHTQWELSARLAYLITHYLPRKSTSFEAILVGENDPVGSIIGNFVFRFNFKHWLVGLEAS